MVGALLQTACLDTADISKYPMKKEHLSNEEESSIEGVVVTIKHPFLITKSNLATLLEYSSTTYLKQFLEKQAFQDLGWNYQKDYRNKRRLNREQTKSLFVWLFQKGYMTQECLDDFCKTKRLKMFGRTDYTINKKADNG